MRDRFNEELSYTDNVKSRGMDQKRLMQMQMAGSMPYPKGTQSQTGFSQASKQDDISRASSFIRARRNTGKHITEHVDLDQREQDVLSVITHDRLKKFNEIQGTVAGNAHDEIAAQAEEAADFARGDEEDEEENKDGVAALKQADE